MPSFRYLLAATAGVALLAGADNANAVPYSYANINFNNLTLSGLGSGTIGGSTVTTSSSASYLALGDAASAGANNNGTGSTPLTGGSDARQSTAGTGPFPGQNFFGQALTSTSGSRGDSIITGNLLTGTPPGAASDVAEGRLTSDGSASSTAGTTTGFSLSFTPATSTSIDLAFNANGSLISTTTAVGDGASGQINASFSVVGGGLNFIYSPDALNTSVSSSSGTGNGIYTLGSTNFDSGSVALQGGVTYQVSLLSGVQERLSAATPAAPVPEPASLALLGAGLAGIGMIRRRRA